MQNNNRNCSVLCTGFRGQTRGTHAGVAQPRVKENYLRGRIGYTIIILLLLYI